MRRIHALSLVLLLATIPAHAGEKVAVRIVQRQDRETGYNYVIPGFSSANSNTGANCYVGSPNVNCSANTHTSGVSTPARSGSYSVRGATFSLLLPDGRIAVVNCESKYKARGDHVNQRSCRTPLVDSIQVGFSGDKAKLFWPVSLDGKKMESETYKILAVLDAPKSAEQSK